MEKIREDLWLTTLSENGGVKSCGFLLLRPEGNILFYKAPAAADFRQVRDLGGIDIHVLSHRHEADPSPEFVKQEFGARLVCDSTESVAIAESIAVDDIFDEAGGTIGDVEVLHTPGHTSGGLSCLFRSPHGDTYLFSGDTAIPVNGKWVSQIVPDHGGNAEVLQKSLARLAALEPTLVLSSASVGEDTAVEVAVGDWSRVVEELASRPPIGAPIAPD
jgi:hydroxyacylglutathione hydrolase